MSYSILFLFRDIGRHDAIHEINAHFLQLLPHEPSVLLCDILPCRMALVQERLVGPPDSGIDFEP
jgi:hypothetical protein